MLKFVTAIEASLYYIVYCRDDTGQILLTRLHEYLSIYLYIYLSIYLSIYIYILSQPRKEDIRTGAQRHRAKKK